MWIPEYVLLGEQKCSVVLIKKRKYAILLPWCILMQYFFIVDGSLLISAAEGFEFSFSLFKGPAGPAGTEGRQGEKGAKVR